MSVLISIVTCVITFILTYLLIFIFSLPLLVGKGIVAQKINEIKGRKGGFAWGFFLGSIGIIVVACRSDLNQTQQMQTYQNNAYNNRLICQNNTYNDQSVYQNNAYNNQATYQNNTYNDQSVY